MSYRGYPIPNLINGVSQQAAQQRRDSQAEEQVNCINSPVDGCTARPGTDHVAFFPDEDWRDAFIYDVVRDDEEQYRVVLLNDTIRCFNIKTGEEGTVWIDDPLDLDYLRTVSSTPKDLFRAITIEDSTFILNREVEVNMVPVQETPFSQTQFEGFIHVKQGDYLATYTVHVGTNNVWYSYTFSTPDNSQGSHASQVKQDYIANQLYRRMRDGQDSSPALPSLGFQLSRIGAVIRIRRSGANGGNFDVGGEDGANQDRMFVFKEQVNRYAQLPPVCWDGTIINVKGSADQSDLNFYVEYISLGGGGRRGRWEECPKPGIPIHLNRGSMPHVLRSLGPNEYEFVSEIWDPRVAGDGDKKGRDPSFVGKTIEDLSFFRDRMGLMTASSMSWSKASQFFSYFPDTVQTTLDDAPVDVRIASTQIAILKHAVSHAEALFLWAQKIQFVVESGEEFAERTVEINPTTAFDYNPSVRPEGVGENLVFTSNSSTFSQVWEQFATAQGVNKEANDITSHVPKYIPASLRWLTGSTVLKLYAMNSAREPNVVYVYNYFLVGEEKQQSAWNKWIFPPEHNILHGEFLGHELRLCVQRPEGVTFETLDCSPAQLDPHSYYHTRLDRKVSEADCTWELVPGQEGAEDATLVTLPYHVSDSSNTQLGHGGRETPNTAGDTTTGSWITLTSEPAPTDGYLEQVRLWSPDAQTVDVTVATYTPPETQGRTVGKITPITDGDAVWGDEDGENANDTIVFPVVIDIEGTVTEIHIALPEIPYSDGSEEGDPPDETPIDDQPVEILVVEDGTAPDTLRLVDSRTVVLRAGINHVTDLDIPISPGQYLGFRTPHGIFHDSQVPGAAPKWIVNGEILTSDTPIDATTTSPHPNYQVQIRAVGRLPDDFGTVSRTWDTPHTFEVEPGYNEIDLGTAALWIDKGSVLAFRGSSGLSYGADSGDDTLILSPTLPLSPDTAPASAMRIASDDLRLGYTLAQTFVTLPEGSTACLVTREGGSLTEGVMWPILSVSGNQLLILGELPDDAMFYFGFIPVSIYEFSEFHPKDERGVYTYERVQVRSVRVACSRTGWTRSEVIHRNGIVKHKSFPGRILGSPTNQLNRVPVFNGTLRIPIKKQADSYRLRLVNDSPFPSQWQAATVDFRPTVRVQRL